MLRNLIVTGCVALTASLLAGCETSRTNAQPQYQSMPQSQPQPAQQLRQQPVPSQSMPPQAPPQSPPPSQQNHPGLGASGNGGSF